MMILYGPNNARAWTDWLGDIRRRPVGAWGILGYAGFSYAGRSFTYWTFGE
jgi:hypothetical protein